jgi:hypothetical protein
MILNILIFDIYQHPVCIIIKLKFLEQDSPYHNLYRNLNKLINSVFMCALPLIIIILHIFYIYYIILYYIILYYIILYYITF